jgi:hypothetical protein
MDAHIDGLRHRRRRLGCDDGLDWRPGRSAAQPDVLEGTYNHGRPANARNPQVFRRPLTEGTAVFDEHPVLGQALIKALREVPWVEASVGAASSPTGLQVYLSVETSPTTDRRVVPCRDPSLSSDPCRASRTVHASPWRKDPALSRASSWRSIWMTLALGFSSEPKCIVNWFSLAHTTKTTSAGYMSSTAAS